MRNPPLTSRVNTAIVCSLRWWFLTDVDGAKPCSDHSDTSSAVLVAALYAILEYKYSGVTSTIESLPVFLDLWNYT